MTGAAERRASNPKGISHLKALIGVAIVPGWIILGYAVLYASRAHQLHGATLRTYAALGVAGLVLSWWVLRKPPAKPASRPYVPNGGPR